MALVEAEQEPPIQLCSNNPSITKFSEKSKWASESLCYPNAPSNSSQRKNLLCRTGNGVLDSIYWTADADRLKNVSLVCDDFTTVLHAENPKSKRGYSKPHAGFYQKIELNKGDIFKPVMGVGSSNNNIPVRIENVPDGCPAGTELSGMNVGYDPNGEIIDVQPICGVSLIPTMCNQIFGRCAEEMDKHIGNPYIRSYIKKKCGDEPSVEICKKRAQLLAAHDETSGISNTGVNLTEKSVTTSEELKTLQATKRTDVNSTTTTTTATTQTSNTMWTQKNILIMLGFIALLVVIIIIVIVLNRDRRPEPSEDTAKPV